MPFAAQPTDCQDGERQDKDQQERNDIRRQ
jgi:hypothetical protein